MKKPSSEIKEKNIHLLPDRPHAGFSDLDEYLFKEGKHFRLYHKLGAHITVKNDKDGAFFSLWAPNAKEVFVFGDFNQWDKSVSQMELRKDNSGIWELFIEGVKSGDRYKYHIVSQRHAYRVDKADPFAFFSEKSPKTSSVVWKLDYDWNDEKWMKERKKHNANDRPVAVYEMHFESWRRVPEEANRPLTYKEMAPLLVEYLVENGFTHIEFMPLMEHPFGGSWGYQMLGFFAPTSRFGTPQELMFLIDQLHQNNIGVIFDWVPSHFPGDEHGLHYFDGTFLFEHQDPRQGFHPDWNSYIFNYGRSEVKEFLISSAHFWFDKYHIDGIRVDAVASMLYLDYSRKHGEWIPNEHGGRENIGAINFLRELNESVFDSFPDVMTIAEESTSWPMVTRPVYAGGLGFSMKWNMGWMHDTLDYFSKDPVHRSFHHNKMTFSMMYNYSENFIMSISHDEVVYGKGSLLNKMPGDEWQKFANLRLLWGYMFAHPGKKLMFMGNEFGQLNEWNHQKSLDWHLLGYDANKGLNQWVKDLLSSYKKYPALFERDFETDGFKWIDPNDMFHSVLSFIRFSKDKSNALMVICNFTPIPRYNYMIGVPEEGYWHEILNSDAKIYGGSGHGNFGGIETVPVPFHNEKQSANVILPPLGMVVFSNRRFDL
jgi:1,4-alpha-glucan branching enzyme